MENRFLLSSKPASIVEVLANLHYLLAGGFDGISRFVCAVLHAEKALSVQAGGGIGWATELRRS